MPGGFHNPLPASLSSECKKATKILDSFINPKGFTLDKTIPRRILAQAKGLAIFTVFKVGMMGSVRFGSGLVVARLPNGTWSAPSAMATGGLGVGGQIGMELTDFVFVLNTDAAVQTFSRSGSLTLGGNVSMAVGPYGRNAEAAGAASINGTASIFAYSKTRGLFGGVTLEGAVMGERTDANKKMYQRKLTAKQLLSGEVSPPPETLPLMNILNSDLFRMPSSSPSSTLPSPLPVDEHPEHRRGQSRVRAIDFPSFQLRDSARPPSMMITELPAQPKQPETPKLDAGPHGEVFELPAEGPRDGVYELPSEDINIPPPQKSAPPSDLVPHPSSPPPPPPPKDPLAPAPAQPSPENSPPTTSSRNSPSPKQLSRLPTILTSGQRSPPLESTKPATSPKRLSRFPTILTVGRNSSSQSSKNRWSRHDPLPF